MELAATGGRYPGLVSVWMVDLRGGFRGVDLCQWAQQGGVCVDVALQFFLSGFGG